MKRIAPCLGLLMILSAATGCTKMVQMEPTSGPPGTAVWIKCTGMLGDPERLSVKWDGKTITSSFPGSFRVPAADQGGQPGMHKVTLVDELDASEAFLIYPIFRGREDSAMFEVLAPQ